MAAAIYDIPLRRIDGSTASLGDHKGTVLLVVNVASRCGLTPPWGCLAAPGALARRAERPSSPAAAASEPLNSERP